MEPISREEFIATMGGVNGKLDIILCTVEKQNSRIFKLEDRAGGHELELAKIYAEKGARMGVSNRLWTIAMALLIPLGGIIGAIIMHVFRGN